MVGVRHMVNPLCVDRSAYLQPQTFLKYSDLGSEQRAFLCTCDSQRTLRPRINLLRRRFGLVYLGLAAMLHKSASRSCGPARGPGTTCFLHSGSRLVAPASFRMCSRTQSSTFLECLVDVDDIKAFIHGSEFRGGFGRQCSQVLQDI